MTLRRKLAAILGIVVACACLTPAFVAAILHEYPDNRPATIQGTPVCAYTGSGCYEYFSSSKQCAAWGEEKICINLDVKPY